MLPPECKVTGPPSLLILLLGYFYLIDSQIFQLDLLFTLL
jgi:hypothetical protein